MLKRENGVQPVPWWANSKQPVDAPGMLHDCMHAALHLGKEWYYYCLEQVYLWGDLQSDWQTAETMPPLLA
jgi:hypothetical protein